MAIRIFPLTGVAFLIVCGGTAPIVLRAAALESSHKDEAQPAEVAQAEQIAPVPEGSAQASTATPEAPASSAPAPEAKPVGPVGSAAPPQATPEAPKGFWGRFADSYSKQWKEDGYVQAAPTPPGAAVEPPHKLPTPFDSPPMPVGEWQLGSGPTIGSHNEGNSYGTTFPLTEALQEGPNGEWWKDSKVHMYGWVDVGANSSSSSTIEPRSYGTGGSEMPKSVPQSNAGGTYPGGYPLRSDYIELDQAVYRFERLPDEYKTDFDWGFRFDIFYGLDYRFTTMNGVFSEQLLKYNAVYGMDFPAAYVDLWYPGWGPQGTNLRIGRYAAPPDIESFYAPDTLMFTHSLLNIFDCYTQMGAFATTKMSDQVKLQYGVNAGCDTAPWTKDAKPTAQFCVQWISTDNDDSWYPCLNAINDGEWAYNNLNSFYNTWTHKFSDKVSMATEYWYMWENNVASCANIPNPGCLADPTAFSPNTPLSRQKRFADEQAILNYVNIRTSPQSFMSIRNEYFDDKAGQRTGLASRYTESAINLTYWLNRLVTFRPELRYEHALDRSPYSFGTKFEQYMVAGDMIVRF